MNSMYVFALGMFMIAASLLSHYGLAPPDAPPDAQLAFNISWFLGCAMV